MEFIVDFALFFRTIDGLLRYGTVRYARVRYSTLGYGALEISDKYGLPTVCTQNRARSYYKIA
jgi:hypothetical protein